ncbi:MAG: hypothetical protein Salg2KO_03730 [Salibacteraceae bacterium]
MEAFMIGALVIVLIALSITSKKQAEPSNRVLFSLFNLLVFISIDLMMRFTVLTLFPQEIKEALKFMGETNSIRERTFIGHPMMHYIGNPLAKGGSRFNSLGFRDREFSTERINNTYRIAAIGGSTTENGYPKDLEKYLNNNQQKDQPIFEVYNFGISGRTTAHSLNNLLLNVIDYQPDALLIHHAWNDAVVRNAIPEKFRSDYSHAFVTMEQIEHPHQFLIRSSMFYRLMYWLVHGMPSRDLMNAALTIDSKRQFIQEKQYSDLTELKPYKRNIQSMIDVGKAHNMDVILTTMPYNLDTALPFHESIVHIKQCNDLLRKMSEEYTSLIFIDVDRAMTDNYASFFTDLGHLNDSGRTIKAEEIGVRLMPSLERKQFAIPATVNSPQESD